MEKSVRGYWKPGKGYKSKGWRTVYHREGPRKEMPRKLTPTDNPRSTVPASTSKTQQVATGDARARHAGALVRPTENGINSEAIRMVAHADRVCGRDFKAHEKERQRRNKLARKLGMSKAERRNGGEAKLIRYRELSEISKPNPGPIFPRYANVPPPPSEAEQKAAYAGRNWLPYKLDENTRKEAAKQRKIKREATPIHPPKAPVASRLASPQYTPTVAPPAPVQLPEATRATCPLAKPATITGASVTLL